MKQILTLTILAMLVFGLSTTAATAGDDHLKLGVSAQTLRAFDAHEAASLQLQRNQKAFQLNTVNLKAVQEQQRQLLRREQQLKRELLQAQRDQKRLEQQFRLRQQALEQCPEWRHLRGAAFLTRIAKFRVARLLLLRQRQRR